LAQFLNKRIKNRTDIPSYFIIENDLFVFQIDLVFAKQAAKGKQLEKPFLMAVASIMEKGSKFIVT
jgi:hypothetical protein